MGLGLGKTGAGCPTVQGIAIWIQELSVEGQAASVWLLCGLPYLLPHVLNLTPHIFTDL